MTGVRNLSENKLVLSTEVFPVLLNQQTVCVCWWLFWCLIEIKFTESLGFITSWKTSLIILFMSYDSSLNSTLQGTYVDALAVFWILDRHQNSIRKTNSPMICETVSKACLCNSQCLCHTAFKCSYMFKWVEGKENCDSKDLVLSKM